MSNEPIQANPLLNNSEIPNFSLQASNGDTITLDDVVGANGIVLAFVHGSFCPFCKGQIKRLHRITPELQAQGVELVCVTHDTIDTLHVFETLVKPVLNYRLLADSEPTLAEQFGITDPRYQSPYPAVFYAGADRKILYSDVSSDPDCYPNIGRLVELVKYGPDGEPDEGI